MAHPAQIFAGLFIALLLAAPASATPVKCEADDTTPGDRVFPEGRDSYAFLRFDEFQCGLKLLESQHPQLLETQVVGTSLGGHPIYDVLMTDETVSKDKPKLLVISSIHGNEVGGREGAARVLEDMVDGRFLADEPWVREVQRTHVIHFLFPNPDGWVAGDIMGSEGAGFMATRGNDNGRDLNRQFPVRGWIDTANKTLAEPEGNAVIEKLIGDQPGGWYLGTDNHGQGPDTYAAAGLQIVGQFDYQKSETLARFADGITPAMAEYGVLSELEALREATGQDMGAYHWGTLFDMLGYSASGSLIDYYNTAEGNDGTGFATELTAGAEVNYLTYPALLDQVWTDSIRAINYTMFKQAIDRRKFVYEVGGRAAYVYDPEVIRHDDANGAGYERAPEEDIPQRPYRVTRMKFFSDLNRSASRDLTRIRVGDDLAPYDSVVLANDAMPEGDDRAAWVAQLRRWVEAGGNLIVTDAAAPILADLGLVSAGDVAMHKAYVGFVDFGDRSDPLNAGLRGVARQTYDTVPIGYSFGAGGDTAPNWTVASSAWEDGGGRTAGTNGMGRTIYGEKPLGKGVVRFLGALLPDPTEDYYHPYGLQNYAVTYTGYTLLQNMLRHSNPERCPARRVVRLRPAKGARKLRVWVNGRRVRARGNRVVVRTPKAKIRVRYVVHRGKVVRRTRVVRLCP